MYGGTAKMSALKQSPLAAPGFSALHTPKTIYAALSAQYFVVHYK